MEGHFFLQVSITTGENESWSCPWRLEVGLVSVEQRTAHVVVEVIWERDRQRKTGGRDLSLI